MSGILNITQAEPTPCAARESLGWSIQELSSSSKMEDLVSDERSSLLKSRSTYIASPSTSAGSSEPLSINNSDPLNSDRDGSVSEMMFDHSEKVNRLKNCGRECLARCRNICHGFSCKRMFYERIPKGRALWFVLLINALESFALFGAIDGLEERVLGRKKSQSHLGYIFVFCQWCGGRIFYPITGLIADTCIGRFRMIKIGLWLMLTGFILITINESLIYANVHSEILESYILPCTAIILLIISSASVEANIIPFGVDQVQQGAPSSEISSYFYYYFFFNKVGIFLGVIVFLLLFNTNISLLPGSHINALVDRVFTFVTLNAIHPLFAVFAVTIALILHVCAEKNYFMDRDYSNPLRLIVNVVYYSATVKRKNPVYRRAFRYGEERKPRIELAKKDFDGIFTSEEVEDVKTFFRICLVIFSLSGVILTFGMTISALDSQVTEISTVIFDSEHQYFLPYELFHLIFLPILLLSTLLMTHLVIPLFPGFRMKLKIGVGVVFTAISPTAAMIIQFTLGNIHAYPLKHLLWMILPILFLSIGHMNIYTAGLEFIYAQSPNSMKGLLTGVFFLWYGVFNGIGIIYFGIFPFDDNVAALHVPTSGVFFTFATCVGVVSVVMYTAVGCIYRNRVRPPSSDEVEDDAVRRGMYGQVSTLNFPDSYSILQ